MNLHILSVHNTENVSIQAQESCKNANISTKLNEVSNENVNCNPKHFFVHS